MPSKPQGVTIKAVKAMPKTEVGAQEMHPDTKRILDAAKGKKPGQIFEAVLSDAKKAKRRRDSVLRYAKRHGLPIRRIIQKGKSLFVEVGKGQ